MSKIHIPALFIAICATNAAASPYDQFIAIDETFVSSPGDCHNNRTAFNFAAMMLRNEQLQIDQYKLREALHNVELTCSIRLSNIESNIQAGAIATDYIKNTTGISLLQQVMCLPSETNSHHCIASIGNKNIPAKCRQRQEGGYECFEDK